jgi:hypothetical protein
MKTFAFLILCVGSVVLADDFKTIDRKEYKNATVTRVETDGIVLSSKSGISKVYFTELPKEVQERFHYDAAKAATFSSERSASEEASDRSYNELRPKKEGNIGANIQLPSPNGALTRSEVHLIDTRMISPLGQ